MAPRTELSLKTIPSLNGGMNTHDEANEIQDDQLRYSLDVIHTTSGDLVRRGGHIKASAEITGTPVEAFLAKGLAAGASGEAWGALMQGSPGKLCVSTYQSTPFGAAIGILSPPMTWTAPAGLGVVGTLGCSSESPTGEIVISSNGFLGIWGGGIHTTNYTTGTMGSTRASTSITGSGTSWGSIGAISNETAKGMYLYGVADDPAGVMCYIGQILSVGSNTAMTLVSGALFTCTAANYILTPVKAVNPRAYKGRITTTTSSTTVTGGNTKFVDNNMGTGIWVMFRKRDMTYIGKVSSVTSNTSITLAANAAVALTDEQYVAFKADGEGLLSGTSNYVPHYYPWDSTGTSATGVIRNLGYLTTSYSNRIWYVLGSYQALQRGLKPGVAFSSEDDAVELDLSATDGDIINISQLGDGASTDITGIIGTSTSLLIGHDSQTSAVFGQSPSQFQLKKVGAEGCFGQETMVAYKDGAVFAGKSGIHYYDGYQATNILSDNSRLFYTQLVQGNAARGSVNQIAAADTSGHAYKAMIYDNIYYLAIHKVAKTVKAINKNGTKTYPVSITIALNLITGTMTLLTNTIIRASMDVTKSSRYDTADVTSTITPYVPANGTSVYMDHGWMGTTAAGATAVFMSSYLTDKYQCAPATDITYITTPATALGPTLYLETKAYDMDEPQRKKLFKQLQINLLNTAAALTVETITALDENADGTVLATTLATSSTFLNRKLKFVRRGNFIRFRIYESSNTAGRTVIGSLAIGFKWLRSGLI